MSDHVDVEVEELDRDECFRLLTTENVGRLAVAERGEAPHVFPVNYRLMGDSVVFRTDPGTKLRLLTTEPVAFEVDFVDDLHRAGWSVVLRGLAYAASDAEIEMEGIEVDPYAPGGKWQWVRLVPNAVTGRRINLPTAAPMDPRGYL
jgi:nitroimidazol reductase NimA-like FMN-containing flavoprotein (pyridoxamine 5'-phosphate oxidase superfamily)